jgi:hypothetical protein
MHTRTPGPHLTPRHTPMRTMTPMHTPMPTHPAWESSRTGW